MKQAQTLLQALNRRLSQVRFWACLSLFALLLVHNTSLAQTTKEPLTINDARLWRSHSTSLSDNGEWYTTHYRLNDKSESKKDTLLQTLVEKTSSEFYNDNNKTDILYIHHADDGLKYQVPDGLRPIFSNDSKWIAYKIVKEVDEKDTTYTELKNLSSGFTEQFQSDASYSFPEDKNYFISHKKNDLVIYHLDNRSKHFIGNVGEYLVDKDTDLIAYTIHTEDNRGNGIYLYNAQNRTTQTLTAGNFIFSNLGWNSTRTGLAAYKFLEQGNETDPEHTGIIVFEKINSRNQTITEYTSDEIKGLPENRDFAADPEKKENDITWSRDGKRLFIKLKKSQSEVDVSKSEDEATVQVWHWKDKKLLSQRKFKAERNKHKTYHAIFLRDAQKVIPVTNDEIQDIIYSEGTDNWAIGTDNRSYISDWDIERYDLYRINLQTGDKEPIEKGFRSYRYNQVHISPDGSKAVLWDEKDFWYYDIASNTKKNITKDLTVSFVNKEYDRYGYQPNYGFVGWVKDRNMVLVNHKLDLWLLPFDSSAEAKNLTQSITQKDSIRFRWEDYSFLDENDIGKRYISLEDSQFLNAFHIKTKHYGIYRLKGKRLLKVFFEPAYFGRMNRRYTIHKSKNSDAILYKKEDHENAPETYLSNLDFSKPRKITHTNPQQTQYKWGKRILINYTNDDGVPLHGVLSIPESYKQGQKLPMIVFSYEKFSQIMYTYDAPFVGAVVSPTLFVSNDYLILFPDIHFNVGTPHTDMHECINAAIDRVVELGYVDENRIGYNGFSFGGHTGMFMASQDNKFAAITAGAGVSNLVQGFNVDIVWDGSNEQDYYMTGQGRLATDPTGNTEMYLRESPVFNAQNMNTPLLLYHGTDDKVVQWEHSFGYYNLLRYLEKPVVLLSYEGEGHGISKEANRLDFKRRLIEFFDHYLKGKEAKPWMIEELPYVPKDK